MASQLQGIQQLLQAEKRAAEKVSKEEARAEIEQYRLQRQKEFIKAKEAAVLGSHGRCSTEVEETQEKMTILQNYFLQNRGEVLDNLFTSVFDIPPEIHESYHING